MSDDQIPGLRDMVDEAVRLSLTVWSKEPGHQVVYRSCAHVRAELVAVLGHRGAAHILRNLADAIEAEIE